jgi:hypothetical protein
VWFRVMYAPRMLPVVICLTAFAFKPPRLVTTGVCALFWYCEKVQSLLAEEDEEIGFEPLSRRSGLRRWWERRL